VVELKWWACSSKFKSASQDLIPNSLTSFSHDRRRKKKAMKISFEKQKKYYYITLINKKWCSSSVSYISIIRYFDPLEFGNLRINSATTLEVLYFCYCQLFENNTPPRQKKEKENNTPKKRMHVLCKPCAFTTQLTFKLSVHLSDILITANSFMVIIEVLANKSQTNKQKQPG